MAEKPLWIHEDDQYELIVRDAGETWSRENGSGLFIDIVPLDASSIQFFLTPLQVFALYDAIGKWIGIDPPDINLSAFRIPSIVTCEKCGFKDGPGSVYCAKCGRSYAGK